MENFSIRIDDNVRLRLYKICRLCGDDNPTNSDILQTNKKVPVRDPDFHKKIFECVGIQVTKGDKMPQTACNACREKINDFAEFREMCLATDIQTRKLLGIEMVVPKHDFDSLEDDKNEVEKALNRKKNPMASKSSKTAKSKGGRPVKQEKKQPPDIKKVKTERDKQNSKVKKKVQNTENSNSIVANKKLKNEQEKTAKATKRKATDDLLTEKTPNKRERLRENIVRKSKNTASTTVETPTLNLLCSICSNLFPNAGELHRHLDTVHLPRIVPYHCVKCDETIEKKQNVRDHNLWHKLSKTPFECGRCGKMLFSLAVYTKHIQNCSVFVQDFEYTTKLCSLCNQSFETQNLYNWHNCIINQMKCEVCQQRFSKKSAMLKHIVRCTAVSQNISLPVVDSALEPEATDPASDPEPTFDMGDHFADNANDSDSDNEVNVKPNLEIDIEMPAGKDHPRRKRPSAPFVVIPTGNAEAVTNATTTSENTPFTVTPPTSSSTSTQECDEDSTNALNANNVLPMVQIKFDGEKAPPRNAQQLLLSPRVKLEVMDPAFTALYDPAVCRNLKRERESTTDTPAEENSPVAEQSDVSNPSSPRPMTPPSPGGMSNPDTPPPTPSTEAGSAAALPKPVLKLVIKKSHGTLNSSFVAGSDVPNEDGEPQPKRKKKKKSKVFKIPKDLAMHIKQEKVDASDGPSGETASANLPVISGISSETVVENLSNQDDVSALNLIPAVRIKQERLDDEVEQPAVKATPAARKVASKPKPPMVVNNAVVPAVVIKQEPVDRTSEPSESNEPNIEATRVMSAAVVIKQEPTDSVDDNRDQSADCPPVARNIREKSRKEDGRKNKNHVRINPFNPAANINREPPVQEEQGEDEDEDVVILENVSEPIDLSEEDTTVLPSKKPKPKTPNKKNINPFSVARSNMLPVRIKQEREDDGYERNRDGAEPRRRLEDNERSNSSTNFEFNVRIKQEPVDDPMERRAVPSLPVISGIHSTANETERSDPSVDPSEGSSRDSLEHTDADNGDASPGENAEDNRVKKIAKKTNKTKNPRIRSELSSLNFTESVTGSESAESSEREAPPTTLPFPIPIKMEPMDAESDPSIHTLGDLPVIKSEPNFDDYDGAGVDGPTLNNSAVNTAAPSLVISHIQSLGTTETAAETEVNNTEEQELLVATDRTRDDRQNSSFEHQDDEESDLADEDDEASHLLVACKEEPISDPEDSCMPEEDQADDELDATDEGDEQRVGEASIANEGEGDMPLSEVAHASEAPPFNSDEFPQIKISSVQSEVYTAMECDKKSNEATSVPTSIDETANCETDAEQTLQTSVAQTNVDNLPYEDDIDEDELLASPKPSQADLTENNEIHTEDLGITSVAEPSENRNDTATGNSSSNQSDLAPTMECSQGPSSSHSTLNEANSSTLITPTDPCPSTSMSSSIPSSQLDMPPNPSSSSSSQDNSTQLAMLHINEIAENNNNANIERELQNDLDSISSNSNLDLMDDGTVASLSEISENSMTTNGNNRNETNFNN